MEKTYALKNINDLEQGDHLCCLYNTDEEHKSLITPFLKLGLEHNEKVLYIVDARESQTVIDYLRQENVDVDHYLEKGQLVILTVDQSYLKEGLFNPDSMIKILSSETQKAINEGYSALRITGEMSWALKDLPGSERLIEYEEKLNNFFPDHPCLAICQYDTRIFGPEILLDVILTHPYVVLGTEIIDNFYYVPPQELSKSKNSALKLEHWINNLKSRKKLEEELKRNKEMFEDFFASSPGILNIIDENFCYVQTDNLTPNYFSLDRESIKGKCLQHLVPEFLDEYGKMMEEVLKTGKTQHSVQVQSPLPEWDDETAYWLASYFRIKLDDDKHGLGVVGIDYTDHKLAERALEESYQNLDKKIQLRTSELREANLQLKTEIKQRKTIEEVLRKSEEEYRNIFNNIIEGIFNSTLEGKLIKANPAFVNILGYRSLDEMQQNISNITDLYAHPEERNHFIQILQKSGYLRNFETQMCTKTGKNIWVMLSAKLNAGEDDQPEYIEGTLVDITDWKEAEIALQKSEENYRLLVENVQEGIWLIDQDAYTTFVNPSMAQMLGYTVEEMRGKHLFSFMDEKGKEIAQKNLERRQKGIRDEHDFQFRRKDGTRMYAMLNAEPILVDDRYQGAIAGVMDVTERKVAEKKLKDSLKRLNILNHIINTANQASDLPRLLEHILKETLNLLDFDGGGIYLLDEEGVAILRYYENLDEQFVEQIKEINIKNYPYNIVYEKSEAIFDYLDINPELEKFGFKSIAAIPLYAPGQVLGSLNVSSTKRTFITDLEREVLESIGKETGNVINRMYSESSLKKTLEEKDLLLREIHHRVKNNLMVISSLLNLQSEYLTDKESKKLFRESQNRAKSMAIIHEKLYQTEDLKNLDFKDYIKSLIKILADSYHLSSQVTLNLDLAPVYLDVNTAVPLGLIVNELVSNSMKHAFPPDTSGEIFIEFYPEDNELILIVGDDGIGLPEGLDFRHTDSLGLQLVVNLTDQIDGQISLDQTRGTKFSIRFKEKKFIK